MSDTIMPALPYRLLWTWDHSTNWALGYAGQVESGVGTAYTKAPQAYVDDYRLLVEWASRHRLNGVVIWGFLRDAHGGIEAAQAICEYANRLGVRILPGVGTSYYGGYYYEGEHPFSAQTRLRRHPECAARDRHGRPTDCLCPTDPANQAWLVEGAAWLCATFAIGGVNLESGDFMVCYCDRCRKQRAQLDGDDPAFFAEMAIALAPVAEEIARLRPDAWITYGTYTGFKPGPLPQDMGEPNPNVVVNLANRGHNVPVPVRRLPSSAIAQWSLTAMVHQEPVPLLAWLDDGCPAALQVADGWPAGLAAPGAHGIGLLHQGSQWYNRGGGHTRYGQELSCIKEACLRGAEARLEGLAITGEASPLNPACELNYLALAHFACAPRDSLRDFARSTLAPLVGGSVAAEAYVTYLAKREAATMSAGDEADLRARVQHHTDQAACGDAGDIYRRWRWLTAFDRGNAARP